MVTRQLQVERRTAKERWSETDVLPLSHADQTTSAGARGSHPPLLILSVFKSVKNISFEGPIVFVLLFKVGFHDQLSFQHLILFAYLNSFTINI